MPHPGKVPLKKVTMAFPEDLYGEVARIVKEGRRWISEADFIRHAVANEVERWNQERPGGRPSPEASSLLPRRKESPATSR